MTHTKYTQATIYRSEHTLYFFTLDNPTARAAKFFAKSGISATYQGSAAIENKKMKRIENGIYTLI